MNFFGHAAVAAWHSRDTAFVLGAMLPDFASMIRARPPEIEEPTLLAGVAHHHATDEVFHDAPEFRALVQSSSEELSARQASAGVVRGRSLTSVSRSCSTASSVTTPTRAARTSELSRTRSDARAYLVAQARSPAAYARLMASVRGRGVSRSHTTPAVVALRLEHTLAGRPRLAIERC
ncbi:MAG: hypothetical protein U0263_15210 [Polyangiaceae bacterium]